MTDTLHPRVSIIVPAFNAQSTLEACLRAIKSQTVTPHEVILYDDGSTDRTGEIAAAAGLKVLRNDGLPKGPAFGRNAAAQAATGDLILFTDADVVLGKDALEQLLAERRATGAVAVFGSYDACPPHRGFASLYMNLRHHFIHHSSAGDAHTFWTGIGLIERAVFLEAGGFDDETYARPSIEDVELGARLAADGRLIRLTKKAQGTHLKNWPMMQVWKTDIFFRAIPWSYLLADGRARAGRLNLSWSGRLSFLATLVLIAGLLSEPFWSHWWKVVLFAGLAYGLLNARFFAFLSRRMPWTAMPGAMAMHWVHHLYAGITFGAIWTATRVRLRRGRRRSARRPLKGAAKSRALAHAGLRGSIPQV